MSYRFEKEELFSLLVRAYNEGNCGFLDSAESVAAKLIEELKHDDPVMTETKTKLTEPRFRGILANLSGKSIDLENLTVVNSNDESS